MTDNQNEGGASAAAPPAQASQPPASQGGNDAAAALKEVADVLLAEVPDTLKALIPDGLDDAGKIRWFQKAKKAGAFGASRGAAVPETDPGKPQTTPREEDLSRMPLYARMARGYHKGA